MYAHRLLTEVISESESCSLRVFSHTTEESHLRLLLGIFLQRVMSPLIPIWAAPVVGCLVFPPEVLSSGEERLIYCCFHRTPCADCFLFSPPLNSVFAFLCNPTRWPLQTQPPRLPDSWFQAELGQGRYSRRVKGRKREKLNIFFFFFFYKKSS